MKLDSPNRIGQSRCLYDHRGHPLSATSAAGQPPRITIVTPSFNQAEFLEECLDSVLSQGYPNLEYIVMDGGSTDGSVDIIKKYERHLAYWQTGPDGGQYPAIQAGLNRGTGDIMAWLNSDDRYWPDTLKTVADAFAGHDAVRWLTGRGIAIDADGQITVVQHLRSLTQEDYLDPERISYLQQESTFWRRDLWQEAGAHIDTSLKLAGDFELWVRFFRHAPLHVIDAVIGCFRIHQGQKTDAGLSAYRAEAAGVVRRERQRLAMPADLPIPQDSPVELITSLVPRQDQYQRLAVRSWLRLGFTVTSINAEEELAFLAAAYPEVNLVAAKRDGRIRAGKPCIYLDDVFDYCRRGNPRRVFGIINSDVHLNADPTLLDFFEREARGALVMGSRQEVDTLDSATGHTYAWGFDYFFFDRTLLDCYPRSEFMLGMPWWDYWVPFVPVQRGYPVKLLTSPVAYHVSHPPAYSHSHMHGFGEDFARLCAASRSVQLHRCHNAQRPAAVGDTDDPDESPDILLLSAFSRYEIYSAAKPIAWVSPHLNLIGNSLVDIEPTDFLVTAIVSTYAAAAFIGECLDDLINQTLADRLEIIVVDAASPEDEHAIVVDYQRRHPHLRYIRTPERIGVYAAWNLAARAARGRYLVSCSTNDRLAGHALEMLARVLEERPEIAITYGSSMLTRKPHQTLADFEFSGAYLWPGFTFRSLLQKPAVGPHAMWRRKLHQRFGYFDESFTAIADQDFWLRVGRHEELWNINDVTGLYWLSDDSLSGNVARAQAEYREINERHRRPFTYEAWLTTRHFTKGIAARYETRLAEWRQSLHFHVCIHHLQTGFQGLAKTIASLSEQYYHDVHIVVASPQPAPAGIDGGRVRWLRLATGNSALHSLTTALPVSGQDWLFLLADGDTVEDRCFLTLGDAIHTHPSWRLVFTDEDEAGNDEAGAIPHFKPGIDPERLRSIPYLGSAPAISTPWLAQIIAADRKADTAEIYDLALRTLETGEDTVGLVQDVLVHRTPGRYDLRVTNDHLLALQAHLKRLGTGGVALSGIESTLRVAYEHPTQPAVVVAVTFSSSVPALERAISSLLERTRYPGFRIVIADCRSQPEPAGDRFLGGIEQMGSRQLEVWRPPQTASDPVQALATLLATIAEDYLVAWPDTAMAVQADWLTTLMSHGQRQGFAAVAPRLITRDGTVACTGMELGVCGPVGSPYRGMRMEYPGEGQSLVTERLASSLDPRCLLLKVSQARRVGGIDPAMGNYWVADLALRLTGQRLLWTPYAIAMVDEDLSIVEQSDLARLKRSRKLPLPDEDRFLERWFRRIGHDPYRNPAWDRNYRGYVPEALPVLVYDSLPWKPVPKIVARAADQSGCGHYRILAPLRALLAAGSLRGGVTLRDLSLAEMSAVEADTWAFQRQVKDSMLQAMEDCARYAPGFRIYEIDDLITQVPENSPHRQEFTPAMLDRFRRGVGLCHRLVVSTQPLADAYGNLAPETIVVPNRLPDGDWRHLSPGRRPGRRPRVGWAGSVSHQADLLMLGEVMAALADEVDWVFLGRCPAPLRPYVRETHPPVEMADYPEKLASLDLDLAVAPLEINAFNEAKSNLKLLEYGVLGYPVVCTDILPYQGDLPVTRVRNRPRGWIDAIRDHVHDLDAATKNGAQLRDHVLAHWMLEDHLDEWRQAWTTA